MPGEGLPEVFWFLPAMPNGEEEGEDIGLLRLARSESEVELLLLDCSVRTYEGCCFFFDERRALRATISPHISDVSDAVHSCRHAEQATTRGVVSSSSASISYIAEQRGHWMKLSSPIDGGGVPLSALETFVFAFCGGGGGLLLLVLPVPLPAALLKLELVLVLGLGLVLVFELELGLEWLPLLFDMVGDGVSTDEGAGRGRRAGECDGGTCRGCPVTGRWHVG